MPKTRLELNAVTGSVVGVDDGVDDPDTTVAITSGAEVSGTGTVVEATQLVDDDDDCSVEVDAVTGGCGVVAAGATVAVDTAPMMLVTSVGTLATRYG